MPATHTAILIPVDPDEPIVRRDIPVKDALRTLQAIVGGYIEAVPWNDDDRVTTYVNEEGKFECERNERATTLMTGTGRLFDGDWIAGPYLIIGFDPSTGEHQNCPADLLRLLAPESFQCQITMGNAAMSSHLDVADALRSIAANLTNDGPVDGEGRDKNGNTVATWSFA